MDRKRKANETGEQVAAWFVYLIFAVFAILVLTGTIRVALWILQI